MLKVSSHKVQLYFVLILGLILRLIQLDRSFSNDEFSAYFRFIGYDSFHDIIEFGVIPDGHPAGIHLFLWNWTKWFGFNEVITRLPFVIAGTIALYFFYKAFQKWYGHKSAITAIGLLAVLELCIFHSQLARPYAFGLLAISIQLYYWVKVHINNQLKWKHYLLMSFSVLASFYIHYMSAFVSVIILVTGILNFKRYWKYEMLFGMIILVLFIPHIDITLHHLSLGGLEWLVKPKVQDIWYTLIYPFNDSAVIFIICLAFIVFAIPFLKESKRWYPIIWFLVFFVTLYLKSIFGQPIMQHSQFLFVLPFLIITITAFKKWNYWWIGIIAMHTIFIRDYYNEQETRYGNFKQIAQEIDTIVDLHPVYIDVNNKRYFQYYLGVKDSLVQYEGFDHFIENAKVII